MPVVALGHDGPPAVAVGADDLAQRRREHARVRMRLTHAVDHPLEAVDLAGEALAAGLRALNAQAELEVFLVADQDVGEPGDFRENLVQLGLAAFPERRAVVEVERDRRAVLLGRPGDLQAERARFRRERPDQPRQVHDLHAVGTEDALQVEVGGVQRAADLTGPVVVHARPARAAATIREVELMPIAPRPAGVDVRAFIVDVPAGQVVLDEPRDGAAGDERRQHLHRQAQVRRDARHVGLRAGRLHDKPTAAMHRLAPDRRQPHPHTRRHQQAIVAIAAKLDGHRCSFPALEFDAAILRGPGGPGDCQLPISCPKRSRRAH